MAGLRISQVEEKLIHRMRGSFWCPALSTEQTYLVHLCRKMRASGGPDPFREWDKFEEEVTRRIMDSAFDKVAEPGTGLPTRIAMRTIYTTLNGPMILELVHLTKIGVSAFVLDKVREQRDRAYRSGLRAVALTSGENGTILEFVGRIGDQLPPYPRKCLKLFLTDGVVELQAIECETLPGLELGKTCMGVKVHLENLVIIGGVAYIRGANIRLLGGSSEARMDAHLKRLYMEFRGRMQAETLQVKVHGLRSPEELFSLTSSSIEDLD